MDAGHQLEKVAQFGPQRQVGVQALDVQVDLLDLDLGDVHEHVGFGAGRAALQPIAPITPAALPGWATISPAVPAPSRPVGWCAALLLAALLVAFLAQLLSWVLVVGGLGLLLRHGPLPAPAHCHAHPVAACSIPPNQPPVPACVQPPRSSSAPDVAAMAESALGRRPRGGGAARRLTSACRRAPPNPTLLAAAAAARPAERPSHRRPRPRARAAWNAASSSASALPSASPTVGVRRRRTRLARTATIPSAGPNPASNSHRSRRDRPASGLRPRPRARRAPRLPSPEEPT